MAWLEYITTAEGAVSRWHRDISGLKLGYEQVKRELEHNLKADLHGWLEKTIKNTRNRTNVFRTISRRNSIKPAFSIIDNNANRLTVMLGKKDLIKVPFAGQKGLSIEQLAAQKNFYRSQAIMRREVGGYLDKLGLAHPSKAEDIRVMKQMIMDREEEMLGIRYRDGRQLKESILRAVTSEEPVATVENIIDNWSINSGFYDSATSAHDMGWTRNYLFRSGETSANSGITGYSTLESQTWTVLPKAVGYSSRVDDLLSYGIFTTVALDKLFHTINAERKSSSDWTYLGLGYNTNELYIPIFKRDEEEAEKWSREKRRALLDEEDEDE